MKASARAPAVILVTPREEGNVGAVARAMANMGLDELILVEPAPPLGGAAWGFGVGGWHVLDRCRRAASFAEAIAPFTHLVGTTSARGRRLEGAVVLTPRELPEWSAGNGVAPWALLFGSEPSGLSRDELARCGALVRIPSSEAHPTLNLAQAVLIVAYELLTGELEASAPKGPPPRSSEPATADEIARLVADARRLLSSVDLEAGAISRTLRTLHQLAARAAPTNREARILRKLCRRLIRTLGSPSNTESRE